MAVPLLGGSGRAERIVVVLTGVLIAVWLGAYLTRHVGPVLGNLGLALGALLAAVSCALAAWRGSGRMRAGWTALSLGCLSWAVGQLIWSIYELVLNTVTPFPSAADVGYLGFPVGAMAALLLFPAGVSRNDRRRMSLDGLMVAGAIGLVSWETVMGSVVRTAAGSWPATAVAVAYPLADIALMVLCILVLSRTRTHRRPLAIVAAGLAVMAFSDSGFAYLTARGTYATGSFIDLGWLLAFALLAVAPLASRGANSRDTAEKVAVGSAVLPYVPLTGALGFVGWRLATGHSLGGPTMVLTTVLVLLVLIRQFLTVSDNQRLAVDLSRREAQLRHQAFHDGLTGLANRALYLDRASHALELHRRDRRSLAACFLDLDGFKLVNDTRGHAAGDDLLVQVAQRLRAVLSEADTLARVGGDEFAILLEDCTDPMHVAHALLGTLRPDFVVDGHRLSVLASVGVALVGAADATPTVDELLGRADLAMYVVKRQGKAGVLLHTLGLQPAELDDVALGRDFARALDEDAVTVLFQPIIDLSTGRVHALEALSRWAPGGTPVPPDVFVALAQRCNLLDELFRVVLETSCQQLARWTTLPGGTQVRVAVNVSPFQLSSPALLPDVIAALTRHGLTGDRLILEVTENDPVTDTLTTRATCEEIRRHGMRLSIDDFGTGLSSLARLRDLPIDEVKIDRSFVADLDRDAGRRRFVQGVLGFATEAGLVVVAEGVETEAERDTLIELGCHRAQGYLYSQPAPANAIDAMLHPTNVWSAPRLRGAQETLRQPSLPGVA